MTVIVTVKCRYNWQADSRIVLPEEGFGNCAQCKEPAVRRENDPATGTVKVTANGYHPISSVEMAKES